MVYDVWAFRTLSGQVNKRIRNSHLHESTFRTRAWYHRLDTARKIRLQSPVPRGTRVYRRTFPGFIIPSGSITRLIVFIRATVPTPSFSTKNSFLIPTPCSPVSEEKRVSALPGLRLAPRMTYRSYRARARA